LIDELTNAEVALEGTGLKDELSKLPYGSMLLHRNHIKTPSPAQAYETTLPAHFKLDTEEVFDVDVHGV